MNLDRLQVMFGIGDLADRYNQHVGVTITSLAMNSSLPVTVHLLYDENLHKNSPEYTDNQEKYHQLEEMFGVEIFYHHIEIPGYVLNHPGTKLWTSAAYLRLFAPDSLPDIDWILYLDGDIIVNMDLAEIWDQPWWSENFAIAACLDTCMFNWDRRIYSLHKKMGVPHDHYCNSGFLLMNLAKIRDEYDFQNRVEVLLRKYPALPFPDQDLLNMIFFEDMYILPEKYNNCVLLHREHTFNNSCIHYVGEKPWRNIDHPVSWEYWKYLSYSPWGNTLEKYMNSVQLLVSRAVLDECVLTGRIISLRKFLRNLVRRGLNEIRGMKKFRW